MDTTSALSFGSVSDLKKMFDNKGKAQTPQDFATTKLTQSQATARHNLQVRWDQQKARKLEKQNDVSSVSDIRQDPRLAGLSESDISILVLKTTTPNSVDNALREILDFDVQTLDPVIDRLSMKELLDRLPSLTDESDVRIGNLRTKVSLQNSQHRNSVDSENSSTLLAKALSKGTERDINRAILQMFFEEFDPSRVKEIDQLLKQFEGNEDELFADIAWNYPGYANKLVTFSIYASYDADNEDEEDTDGEEATVLTKAKRRPSYIVSPSAFREDLA